MKNIAYVLEAFPNLSETFIIDQMIYVASEGHKVCLYYDHLNTQHSQIIEKVKSFDIQFKERWIGAKLLKTFMKFVPYRFKYLLMRAFDALSDGGLNKYDMVLAHFGQNGLRLAYSKKYGAFKKPFMTFFHGYDVGGVLKNGRLDHYKELLKSGDIFLAVNGYFKDLLVTSGAPSAKTHVFHMGIDCDDIHYKEPEFKEPIKFISVCRLVEKKGIQYVVEALNDIHTSHPHLNWEYHIIGDGPLLNDLKQRVNDYNLGYKISFLGSMPHADVKAKLSTSDVFVLPSVTAPSGDVEGIPVVLMEAMGTGLLACSTYHSGIPELIEHQKTGLLSAEKDVKQLAANMLWVVQNPEQCKMLTQNARAYVEQEFNKETLYKQLLNYL